MKNQNIKMKTIEWIAMIWTLPIAIVVLAGFGIITLIHTSFRIVLFYSGTAGAGYYIASTMRKKMSNFEWAKIARDDHRQHVFNKNSAE